MWRRPFRCLLSILVAVAFLGGASLQAMPANDAAYSVMAGCAEMSMQHDADARSTSKGMTPDCVKSMQCLGIPDSPTRTSMVVGSVSYDAVAYWPVARRLSGLSVPPPASPPRPV